MDLNIELLKNLCLSSGISGNENAIREIIIKEISNLNVEHHTDALGNLIVFKKGKKRPQTRLMLAAHMDEVGFIVTHITENGYLGFEKVGGINDNIIPGINVLVGNNRIAGVIGLKPIHLSKKDDLSKIANSEQLLIDIGAKNKNDAMKYVSLGDTVTFDSIFDSSNNRIISKALDDRAGCFILINILKSELEYDTYFVFTVQEEIGLRGATTASYTVEPQAALVIEATTANDIPNSKSKICELNKGPAISFMDKSTIYNKEYYRLAIDMAQKNNINIQPKSGVTGGNDSGAIHISRRGVKTLVLSVPCRYLHTPAGIISTQDLNDTYRLASILSEKISSMKS